AIGVTMPHPHGQIYAFPFLPPLIKTELASASEHSQKTGECVYCGILRSEIADGRRFISSNATFVAFLPFFGRFPTELQIYSRRHIGSLQHLSEQETCDLASLLSIVRRKYDGLY